MKARAISTNEPAWPAGVPFFVPSRESRSKQTDRFPRQTSVGPIELRIDGSDGPSAIAILE